jgi:hypothetical protein
MAGKFDHVAFVLTFNRGPEDDRIVCGHAFDGFGSAMHDDDMHQLAGGYPYEHAQFQFFGLTYADCAVL